MRIFKQGDNKNTGCFVTPIPSKGVEVYGIFLSKGDHIYIRPQIQNGFSTGVRGSRSVNYPTSWGGFGPNEPLSDCKDKLRFLYKNEPIDEVLLEYISKRT